MKRKLKVTSYGTQTYVIKRVFLSLLGKLFLLFKWSSRLFSNSSQMAHLRSFIYCSSPCCRHIQVRYNNTHMHQVLPAQIHSHWHTREPASPFPLLQFPITHYSCFRGIAGSHTDTAASREQQDTAVGLMRSSSFRPGALSGRGNNQQCSLQPERRR